MTYISLTSSQRQSCHHETHKTSQSPIGSSLWILFNIGISDVYQNLEAKLSHHRKSRLPQRGGLEIAWGRVSRSSIASLLGVPATSAGSSLGFGDAAISMSWIPCLSGVITYQGIVWVRYYVWFLGIIVGMQLQNWLTTHHNLKRHNRNDTVDG